MVNSLLDIRLENNLSDIIFAYTEIFGEEYREIITERLINCVYIQYINYGGLKDYYNSLCDSKKMD